MPPSSRYRPSLRHAELGAGFYDIVQAVGGPVVAESCEGEGFDPGKPLSAQI